MSCGGFGGRHVVEEEKEIYIGESTSLAYE